MSPNAKRLKPYVTLHMAISVLEVGMTSTMTSFFVKLTGQLLESGEASEHISLCVVLFVVFMSTGFYQVRKFNCVMQEYD